MDIKVFVPLKRKCAASLDWGCCQCGEDAWILSFGDLNRPDTDVEVCFSSAQLNELEVVVKAAQTRYSQMIKDAEREKKQAEEARAKARKLPAVPHYGSC